MWVTNYNIIGLTPEGDNNRLVKFIADSGATEHMTNSSLIFKSLDCNDRMEIHCANKNDGAIFRSEGVGDIHATQDDNQIKLDKVICAESLSENLLSLRRFVDQGLKIYLDNERIDIFDPISNEIFMSGIYQKPYWVIELETITTRQVRKSHDQSKIIAYLAVREPRCAT